MRKLTALFNRLQSVAMKKDVLANIVAPFMQDGRDRNSKQDIADAWKDVTDWLRIGFHGENNKGTSYECLYHALRVIYNRIEQSDPATDTVYIKKIHMRVLRDTYFQLDQAANYLHLTGQAQGNTLKIAKNRDGAIQLVRDFNHDIPLYNRPNESHMLAAQRLQETREIMGRFFETSRIPPASQMQLVAYLPPKHPKR